MTEKIELKEVLKKITGKASKDIVFDIKRSIMNTFDLGGLENLKQILPKGKIAKSDWKALMDVYVKRKKDLEKIQRIHKRREEVVKGLKGG